MRSGEVSDALVKETNDERTIVLGSDFRSYSRAICNALALGLIDAGIEVIDIGTVISPVVYFARFHLGIDAMAMVTASHNPDGWTGVKFGFRRPHTCSPAQMDRLRELVLAGNPISCKGGGYHEKKGVAEAYIDALAGRANLSRRLRVICATGNGTAGAFAPDLLRRLGMDVIDRHTTPDFNFPNYNPNPESLVMLNDMKQAVIESGADLAFGFDGDGDRLGLVDDRGTIVHADKAGLLIARRLARRHPTSKFIVDIKSTSLFEDDVVLGQTGATVEYWKTGHGHMKSRLAKTGALAGFEKSGHYYFGSPLGYGFDCGLQAAVAMCQVLEESPGKSLSQLHAELPDTWITPTMSPACPDESKYKVVDRLAARLQHQADEGITFSGQPITGLNLVNGVRARLANGSWVLARASSNTPNLVVVCESRTGQSDLETLVDSVGVLLATESEVAPLDR